LNADAGLIFLGMIDTGYPQSEGADLPSEEIRLDADVPQIFATGC
jgi:hypothetical protein